MKNDRLQEAYEDWAEEWKPRPGENHPNSYDAFEAGWLACIEIMLERLELSKA
jgi:hypothetical protein